AFISVFYFVVLYTRAVKDETEGLKLYLKNFVAAGSQSVRGDDVATVPLDDSCQYHPAYLKLTLELKKIAKIDPRIDDAYLLVPTDSENTLQFVTNANKEVSPVACGERYDAASYPEMQNAFAAPAVDKDLTRDKWGTWLSAYAPVFDSGGKTIGILGVDVAAKTIEDLKWRYLERLLVVIGVVLALSFLIGLLTSQWLTKHIDQIVRGMERVTEGDLNYSLKTMPEKEFNCMVVMFNKMTSSIRCLMKDLAETVREKERINRELEIAADLQMRALPAGPPVNTNLDIAAKSIPAKEVGGDYFDFISDGSPKIGFVVADAAGKGVSGTLYMTNSRSIFRVISSEERIPAMALNRTNDYIFKDSASTTGMFITFLYAVYDPTTRKLVFSNAGHYLPLIYEKKTGRFKSVHGGGIPLGVYPEQNYPEETVELAQGDIVVMYTDGVIEAMNSRKDMFGLTRLMKIVEERHDRPAAEILDQIDLEMKRFSQSEPQFDDITLLVFKVR
ncbi:MAG TPA: SpoIIE family protein phosphatase, partial [Candidatus Omnitrophota bacterium]|nr:SpoIIE family protein phosphatase [Candidatus Omnitrophota bacterium]